MSGIREIFGRRIGGGGTIHAGFAIVAGDGVDRSEPDVAYDPVQNRYLVVYGKDTGSGIWNIWERLIPALGPNPSLNETNVGYSADSQTEPAVTFGRGAVVAEKFLVVWIEDPLPTPVIDQIYAAFVDGASGSADNRRTLEGLRGDRTVSLRLLAGEAGRCRRRPALLRRLAA